MAAGSLVVATLGSSLNGTGICAADLIAMGQYKGLIDDFQVYSRELSASDIATLVNS